MLIITYFRIFLVGVGNAEWLFGLFKFTPNMEIYDFYTSIVHEFMKLNYFFNVKDSNKYKMI